MAKWQPKPKIINHKSPNLPVVLYRGFGEVIDGEIIVEGQCLVKISWYPFPRVTIDFKFQLENRELVQLKESELKLTELVPQERLKVCWYQMTWKSGENEASGYLVDPLVKGKKECLSSLTFHIPNFYCSNISNYHDYEFNDEGIEKEIQRESWLDFDSQLIFDYGNWHIVLGTLEKTYDLQEKLEIQGGYGVTHICKVERLDNTQFNLDEGYEIINAFVYYLSFVRRIWLAPLFVSGFDAKGNQILEEWRTPTIKVDSWQSPWYLWAKPDTTDIVEVFSGFMKKWQDSTWEKVIRNSIQWYIESFKHQTGYNTSIILIQAALEKLAWTYLNVNKCVTSSDFSKLQASGQIRLLLKFLNIDLIPFDSFPKIKFKANERRETWVDTVQALTEIRNAAIHPSSKGFSPSEEIMQEAFFIGYDYLLQCLLKLFEYP
jgi:hypothetical protein